MQSPTDPTLNLTMEQAKQTLARFRDFALFASSYWEVRLKSGGFAPFDLNLGQTLVDQDFRRQMDERGYVRQNDLKCRQIGDTTYWTRRALHYAMMYSGRTALTIAHEERLPQEWFAKCRETFEKTPNAIRPGTQNVQGYQLRFDNGSRYYIGSAQGGFPAVGDTVHFLHLSELGRWDKPPISIDPQRVLTPLDPAIPTGEARYGTVVVRESTGVMRGDYWHKTWQAGKERGSEFTNIFLPWFLCGEYRREDLAAEIVSLTPYEQELVRTAKRYGVDMTHAHLAWRRVSIRESPFFGNTDLWAAEFPATEDEAFMSAGLAEFTREEIAKARLTVREPLWRGHIIMGDRPDKFELVGTDAGSLMIFDHDPRKGERPRSSHLFGIGADVQWGERSKTLDFDCAFAESANTRKVAAELYGRWNMGQYALQLAGLGHYYNQAVLAPERQGMAAEGVIRPLLGQAANNWSYPNLYYRDTLKRMGIRKYEDYGWSTTPHTKPELIALTHQLLSFSEMDWADSAAVDELASIIKQENQTIGAPVGQHDDKWMSRMITEKVTLSIDVPPETSETDDWDKLNSHQQRMAEYIEAEQERDRLREQRDPQDYA
ncbi:MAG: hypothetical protein IMZ62_07985 [Chloroflexi bacterium]|nr:hypothetical protein [Chloroflexota bacterium]MBE3118796.1 hypothetical protein [Candidatus Atribacteria bacterium]